MQIILKTKGSVVLTNEIRGFVDERVGRVEKFFDDPETALVEVELGTTAGGQRTGDVYRAEINIKMNGGFFRAEASRDTLHSAIDEAFDEVRQELRKSKTKKRDLMRRGAGKVKDFFRKFRGN